MSKDILRNEDFKTSSNPINIQGMYYRGDGHPIGRLSSVNAGTLYLDNLSGQLWICSISNSVAYGSWIPFFSDFKQNIAIDTDVVDGDFVGIFGIGAWSVGTALPATRSDAFAFGTQAGAMVAGGYSGGISAFNPVTNTTIFNGTSWNASGNMPFRLAGGARAGAVNAGMVFGGGNGTVSSSLSYNFDGSTWTQSGSLAQTCEGGSGSGSANAAWIAGGANANGNLSRVELFNGSVWSFHPNIISVSRSSGGGFGSQYSAVYSGGANTPYLNIIEIFNGSAWSRGANINATRIYHSASGSMLSGWICAGERAASNPLSTTEIFNGSVWSSSGLINQKATHCGNGTGSTLASLIAGGMTPTLVTNRTELHAQSTYRKLDFANIKSAANIGMAYGVSTTSLTATLLNGDIPSTFIPSNTMFGINKFNTSQTHIYISNITGTVLSVSASGGTATLNLSTTMTNSFWQGAAILIKHASNATGTKFPIIGGTDIAPIVRWVNASSTSVSSFTFSCVFNNKIENLTGQAPEYDFSTGYMYATFSNVGNISATALGNFQWVKVGDVINIPYASVSGANGSQTNYGSFLITRVDLSAGSLQLFWSRPNASTNYDENYNIGGISIYQQWDVNSVGLDSDSVRLGLNNKMHVPMLPFDDDAQNGFF